MLTLASAVVLHFVSPGKPWWYAIVAAATVVAMVVGMLLLASLVLWLISIIPLPASLERSLEARRVLKEAEAVRKQEEKNRKEADQKRRDEKALRRLVEAMSCTEGERQLTDTGMPPLRLWMKRVKYDKHNCRPIAKN